MSQQHKPAPLPPSTVNLVSQLGHDFNNLLGIILGGLSLLQEDLPAEALDSDLKIVLEDMLSATQDAGAIIERLTEAAGRQIISARSVDLNALIGCFEHSCHNSLPEGVRLRTQCTGQPVWAWVDPVKLQNCLQELVTNAVTAMEGCGELALICIASPAPGIEVVDNGPGMDRDLLKSCAQPYLTTWRSQGHRGLGLSLVHGFLQASGAVLQIESGPGEGTRVSMEFESPPGNAASGSSNGPATGNSSSGE